MLEQALAMPYDINAERLINRLSEKLLLDTDRKMLEKNPIVRLKSWEDKIVIEPVDPGKVYLQSGANSASMKDSTWFNPEFTDKVIIRKVPDITIDAYEKPLELTLINGVFE